MEMSTMGADYPGKKKSKGKAKMYLSSVNIEMADGGGFIVRCSYEGKKKNGDTEWDSKTKLFMKAKEVAHFTAKAIMEYEDHDEEMEDEDMEDYA